MKQVQWESKDTVVLIIVFICIFCFCFSCARDADEAREQSINEAYTEGYDAGYYDGENGNPYNDMR